MILTAKFRLFPSPKDQTKLHEIFTIYNRIKRIGYKYQFYEEIYKKKIFNSSTIHQALMKIGNNNPYVISIINEIKEKIETQKTSIDRKKKYLLHQIDVINTKIGKIKNRNKKDRRLNGLYRRLSSVQNQLKTLRIKPLVFGTKSLFRKRIQKKISNYEFRINRDSSFYCIGKRQGQNLNIKILPNGMIKIHTFSKIKGKRWLTIPCSVNKKQQKWINDILRTPMYSVRIVRRFIRGELKHFAHVSYENLDPIIKYSFDKGAIGLDFNYNFISITNIDKNGEFLSYKEIKFNNLHTYRKTQRNNYIHYKMGKMVNFCINKKKGLVIEDLSFDRMFSYNKVLNRKLNDFNKKALNLLERKCIKKGVSIRKVHPAYTSIIGKYKYSGSYNLSTHILASYVIARRGLGFKEDIPTIYKWLLAQVGGFMKPRLKPSSPYFKWSQIYDCFKHSGITSFKTSEIVIKTLLMKDVLNLATSTQSDNLRTGLSINGMIEDWNNTWSIINNHKVLR
ncbi:MAG: IS200/IS605 family accessory protein TnpB-related protein [Promethearchaeota archaeon]